MMRKLGLVSLALALLCFVAAPALAQETRGSIEGGVKDATGGGLPGATVQAKSTSTAAQMTVTDTNGTFRFPALQPGIYVVTVTLNGFSPATRENIDVKIGAQLKVDFTMTIAGVKEQVDVKALPPIVDVKQNSVTTTVSSDIIDLLPKDRNFLSALSGIAGMSIGANATDASRQNGVMIDGASPGENRIIIDGQDTTELRTGTQGKDVVIDFIDQIQVKQSGYNAEYRATTGGVISAITKSGSNQYHGDFGTYYSGRRLYGTLGAPRRSLGLDTTDPQNAFPFYTTPARSAGTFETDTYNPIYSVGGPVIKNHAWFFFGSSPTLTTQNRTVRWSNSIVSGATGLVCSNCADPVKLDTFVQAGVTYPGIQTFNAKSTNAKYTYNGTIQLNRSMRARISANNERSSNALGLPSITDGTFGQAGDGVTVSTSNPLGFNPRPQVHTRGYNDSYSGTLDWVISNKMYANITGGYLNYGTGSIGGTFFNGVRRSFGTSNINVLGLDGTPIPAELQHASGFTDNNSNTFTTKDAYNRLTLNGDVTRYADWRGQHAFKAGMQLERFGNDVNQGQQMPVITFNWNSTLTTADGRQVRGNYGYYNVVQQFTVGNIKSNNMGIFLQDQWTMNNKLTLNYGVRADRTNIPSYRESTPGITFGWSTKVAPRLGFAYDIKGDSKWKAYGSWGVFYDIEKLELPRGAWGAEYWNTLSWTLDTYNFAGISCDGYPTAGLAPALISHPELGPCGGTYITQNDLRHVSNDPADPSHNTVDPNMKPVKAEELVFGIDHELNRMMSVGSRYVHKWIDRTIEDVGVNVAGLGELFYIANPGYGLGAYPYGPDFPRTPGPIRHYDALELTWSRRQANNWSLRANYTLSRLFGNYSGLSSSDENGRNSPGVNRFYDGLFMNFTEKGCPTHNTPDCVVTYGLLATDSPHVINVQGTYIAPWGTAIGVNTSLRNGLTSTSTVTYKGVPVMIYNRGNLGRLPTNTNTDINFQQIFKLPHRMRVTLQLDVKNVFDQDTTNGVFTSIYRSNTLTLPGDTGACPACATPFFAGFDTKAAFEAIRLANLTTGSLGTPNTTLGRLDPRFGMDSGFKGPRRATAYVKFSF